MSNRAWIGLAIAGAVAIAMAVAMGPLRSALETRHAPRAPLELWLYYAANLADDDEVARLESVWRRAAAAGYRHVMLADQKFARLDEMDAHYFDNARRVRRLAADLGLEIVPGVFQLGRSASLLAHDPDLAEALPVRGALFEARGGVARVVPDPPVAFAARPDLRDPAVRIADGRAFARNPWRVARFMYRVRVQPWRCYHVSAEVRTADFSGTPRVLVMAEGRPIQFMRTLGVDPTQDWTRHDAVFNSLAHSEVEVYFGAWGTARGTLEWRNWRIEEIGPLNAVRRPGAPAAVSGAIEGAEVDSIRDPRVGQTPWRGQFDVWHEPPVLRTSLPDGRRFRASWYQAAVLYEGQVMACVSEPAVQTLLADEARRMRELWRASGYLMMIDEIRVMNRDSACVRRGLSPGALLAEQARRCRALLAGAVVYTWSDMFDPHHNAVRDYHLVDGDLAGSWEGLSPDVVIVNWNSGHARESLRFFAGRGHRQILAGYYDGPPEGMRGWLRAARGVKGVEGVMYATWQSRFDDLETFARVCRAAR